MRKVIGQQKRNIIKADSIDATEIIVSIFIDFSNVSNEEHCLYIITNGYRILIGNYKSEEKAMEVQKDLWRYLSLGEKCIYDYEIPEDEEETK